MYEEHKIISARYIKRGKRKREPFHHRAIRKPASSSSTNSTASVVPRQLSHRSAALRTEESKVTVWLNFLKKVGKKEKSAVSEVSLTILPVTTQSRRTGTIKPHRQRVKALSLTSIALLAKRIRDCIGWRTISRIRQSFIQRETGVFGLTC